MSGRVGKSIALGLGVVLVAGFFMSQRPHPPHAAEPSNRDAIQVRLTEVREQSLSTPVEALGSLRSSGQIAMASRLTARVLLVHVTAGAAVAAGDVMIELEATDLEARVAASSANLTVADRALDEARREEQRTRTLFERDARTQQELDAATTRTAAADATREAAAGDLAAARAALDHALLRAPFDGVVLTRSVDPGDLATPGKPLLELYDPDSLRIEAALPERLLGQVAIGDSLVVVIDALRESGASPSELVGRIDEIVPAVDAASRTALVKLALPQTSGALPGMFGRVRVPDGERVAVVVPRDALVRRGQLEIVFSVSERGQQAAMHLVRSGREVGADSVELLSGGGDVRQVIVEGAGDLYDGAPVRVVDAASAGR